MTESIGATMGDDAEVFLVPKILRLHAQPFVVKIRPP